MRFDRSSHRYRAIRNDQAMLRGRIRELAAARVRYGYFRLYILLRREVWKINHKRVYRLYRSRVADLTAIGLTPSCFDAKEETNNWRRSSPEN